MLCYLSYSSSELRGSLLKMNDFTFYMLPHTSMKFSISDAGSVFWVGFCAAVCVNACTTDTLDGCAVFKCSKLLNSLSRLNT